MKMNWSKKIFPNIQLQNLKLENKSNRNHHTQDTNNYTNTHL